MAKKTKVIQVLVTDEEKEYVQRMATKNSFSESEYMIRISGIRTKIQEEKEAKAKSQKAQASTGIIFNSPNE